MEKIKLWFTVFILLTLSAGAFETSDYKKIKENKLVGIENKSNGEIIIPVKYKKIKKPIDNNFVVKNENNKWQILTINNEPLLEGEFDKVKILKDSYQGIYNKNNHTIHITNGSFNSKDFTEKIYEHGNKISNIKFYNYPDEAVLILQKHGKYGFLAIRKNKLIYVPPIYHEIYVPDNNSIIFNILGLSYCDVEDIMVYDGYYWFSFDNDGKIKNTTSVLNRLASLYIEEKAEIENNTLTFSFQSKSDLFKNIALTAFPKGNNFGIGKILSFPKNRIEVLDDTIKIYYKKQVYSINKNNYEDFYFQDFNTVIFNVKNISFSNPERIFAKKKGFWGIIDKYENVISDFQYDDVIGLSAKEDVKLIPDGKKFNFDYKNIIFPKNNIFLVKKGDLYGVIDINGQILLPFKKIANNEAVINHKEAKNSKQSENTFKKTQTDTVFLRPYSTILPAIPSFILFSPNSKTEKKIFKKAI